MIVTNEFCLFSSLAPRDSSPGPQHQGRDDDDYPCGRVLLRPRPPLPPQLHLQVQSHSGGSTAETGTTRVSQRLPARGCAKEVII